jgi:hypothetical protein
MRATGLRLTPSRANKMALGIYLLSPALYYVLKRAAESRHEALKPVLGTHAKDVAMRIVYPL